MSIYQIVTPGLIKTLGIITYSVVALALLGGLLRRQLAPVLKKAYLPVHRALGIIALSLATIHGLLVLLFY